MKYAHISIKATLEDRETIQHVLDHLRTLLPADRVQIECSEYVEMTAEDKNHVIWLRDYGIDLPWERVESGFDGNGGEDLTEAASDFIAQAGVVKALYGTYPDPDKYGMPAWAAPDDVNEADAKITVAEYGFAVANQDFEVVGRNTHDDSGGTMWLMVCLSEQDYLTFEGLQSPRAGSEPTAEVGQ